MDLKRAHREDQNSSLYHAECSLLRSTAVILCTLCPAGIHNFEIETRIDIDNKTWQLLLTNWTRVELRPEKDERNSCIVLEGVTRWSWKWMYSNARLGVLDYLPKLSILTRNSDFGATQSSSRKDCLLHVAVRLCSKILTFRFHCILLSKWQLCVRTLLKSKRLRVTRCSSTSFKDIDVRPTLYATVMTTVLR